MSLLSRVRRFAARHSMWQPATRVVAAVSGGSDSVAMLFLLHGLHQHGELRLAAVAHLNHRIRPEADDDAAFCQGLAERLAIPFLSGCVDVPALARARKQSLELAGRAARREFLNGIRRTTGADVIATAHTEDDQAETVLLRLMRGAGPRGLAGMAPARDRRIRPLLCATRAELRHFLTRSGEEWREDSSNADVRHLRNRVRHELLPYLERRFNPSVKRALVRTADAARVEDALITRITASARVGTIEDNGDQLRVDVDRLRAMPQAVQRRLLLEVLSVTARRAASHDDVARFLARMEHLRGKVVLVPSRTRGAAVPAPPAPFCFELPVPGMVRTDDGWVVEAERFDLPRGRLVQPDVAQIDAAAVQGSLSVRSRRPGDRVRPLGLGGSRKVQDVLVDRKVSRQDRDAVPIVTDSTGEIVWVAGHVLGEAFRVTEGTKGVIILKLRRV